ncbi:MAG: hydrogenase maturation nickel metallochaperone HypA [Sporichthyaceae bacterium]
MHELSLCAAIADIAARRAGDRRVEVVHLRVGQLRQVVPDALEFCWSMLVEDTDLAGASLDLDLVDAVLDCRGCGTRTAVAFPPSLSCGACGGFDVCVLTGEEFEVVALDLAPV